MKIANVTLHVGIGTFRPVKEENIEEHKMHTEHFYIKQEDVDKINETKKYEKPKNDEIIYIIKTFIDKI